MNRAQILQAISNKRVAIWDFDGTIADSEATHMRSYQDILTDASIDPDHYYLEIASLGGGVEKLVEVYGGAFDAIALKEKKRERYAHHISRGAIKIFAEIPAIVELQHRLGMRVIVASNTAAATNRLILEKNDIDPDLFDLYFAPGPQTARKPDPEMFLQALAAVNEPSENAIVLEDTHIGTQAGVSAKIDTLYLRAHHNERHELPPGGIDCSRELLLSCYEELAAKLCQLMHKIGPRQ